MPPQSPISSPCADAWRGLVPSGTRRAVVCPHFPPGSPLRVVTARYRLASPTSRSEPRLLSARTLRGSALPAPPPLLLPAVCPALSPPTAALSSLLLPDGLASSEPRSVRADGIPGSERSAATATRQRGGRSASRRPGGGERRPPFGRAAERARSAARASPGHPPAHSAPTPLRLILYLHRSILYPRRPLLSPPAGWAGVLGAAERAGRCYPRFGAARRPPPRVSGAVERAA